MAHEGLERSSSASLEAVRERTRRTSFKPSVDGVAKAINSFPPRKGTGRDGLPAEVLQAGGEPIAERLAMLIHAMIETEQVPSELNGG